LCREQVRTTLRSREREIAQDAGLDARTFVNLRFQLVELYERFRLACAPGACTLTYQVAWRLLQAFGFLPKRGAHRKGFAEDLWETVQADESSLTFKMFTEYIDLQLQARMERCREDVEKLFESFCTDDNSTLSMKDASQLLEQLRLMPKTREDQEEIRALFLEVDRTGSGRFTQQCFEKLNLRIDEHLQQVQYEAWMEKAVNLGVLEEELGEAMALFAEADITGSDCIDIKTAGKVLSKLQERITQEQAIAMLRAQKDLILQKESLCDFAALLHCLGKIVQVPRSEEQNLENVMEEGYDSSKDSSR